MTYADNFLHTTHRTVNWFRKAFANDELELAAPFQRNPVWTDVQKAYLIDTILNGLPIPELYMQDFGDEHGGERHVVVDGQQRIRAVLDFIEGLFALSGDDIKGRWKDLKFDDLHGDDKKTFFAYKFVVRILPPSNEEEIRKIFSRLNRNVVALNEQELRNATYWGPFIKTIQFIADEDSFWSEAGIFSANDHRRMLDHEFISELVIASLHGTQNKKDKLDHYYRLYEQNFEDRGRIISVFRKVTGEIEQIIPRIASTRWRKRSDFYTLFLALSEEADNLPWPQEKRQAIAVRLADFAARVEKLLRIEEGEWQPQNEHVVAYARNVARAASDRSTRQERAKAFRAFVLEGQTEDRHQKQGDD